MSRTDINAKLVLASGDLQAAYDEALRRNESDTAGHIRAAQLSLNSALGAHNKKQTQGAAS